MPDRRVEVYAEGVCMLSACAPKEMTGAEVEHEIRSSHPSGTECGWHLSNNAWFSPTTEHNGKIGPIRCDSDPERRHWLFEC